MPACRITFSRRGPGSPRIIRSVAPQRSPAGIWDFSLANQFKESVNEIASELGKCRAAGIAYDYVLTLRGAGGLPRIPAAPGCTRGRGLVFRNPAFYWPNFSKMLQTVGTYSRGMRNLRPCDSGLFLCHARIRGSARSTTPK